jgi:hypothetical protein
VKDKSENVLKDEVEQIKVVFIIGRTPPFLVKEVSTKYNVASFIIWSNDKG